MSDQTTPPVRLDEGIYIGLCEDIYFSQKALGSTDLKALYLDAESWWWDQNPNSPLRKEETPESLAKRADSRRIGSALHACLLEGLDAYEARFALKPEKDDFPNALDTAADLQAWLKEHELPHSGAKAKLIERVLNADPKAQIWEDIVERALAGRQVMYRAEDLRIRLMRRIIENDRELSEDLGRGVSEVSVFWRDPITKMMHRARFDRLTPRGPWDVKSFTRRRNITPKTGALRRAQDEGWHIQAAAYWEAWDLMPELPVIGGTDNERALISSIQESIRAGMAGSDFGWLFCPVNGAPSPLPLRLKRAGLITVEGEKRVKEAKENFAAWARLYGFDEPWIEVSGIQDIEDEEDGYGFWRAA